MDLQVLLPGLETILGEVGAYLLKAQHTVIREEKAPGDPVSEADRTAEKMLRDGLKKILPEAEFRGEESGWSNWPETMWCWVVDPIDGTDPYLRGREDWAISVALLKGPMVMLGAIHAPAQTKTYLAIRGEGATLNGDTLRVSDVTVDRAHIISSASKKRLLETAGIRRKLPAVILGDAYASTILCSQVARGEAEAYVQFASTHTKEWDIAAGTLIVEEAGGRVSDFAGHPIRFDKEDPLAGEFIISNSSCHEGLLRTLQELDLPK